MHTRGARTDCACANCCMCVCMCKYGRSTIRQGSTPHVPMHVKALGYRGGLRVGDRLLSVNGAHCTDPSLATSLLKAAAGRVSLQIMRDLGGRSSRSSQASPASVADAATPADAGTVVRSQSWAAKIKARLEAKAEAKAARERRIAAAMTAKELSGSFKAGRPMRETPTSEQSESASVRTVLRSPSFLQRLKRQSSSLVHQSSIRSPHGSPEESPHESPKPSPASSSRDKSPVGRGSLHGLKEESTESLNESSEFKPLPLTNTVEQLRTPLGANDAGGRRGSFGMTVSLE